MNRLKKAINTVKWTAILLVIVIGTTVSYEQAKGKDAYPMPEIVTTNSVSPVQYTAMRDARN